MSDEEDVSERRRGRKGDREPVEDKSVPEVLDEAFVRWGERCFRGDDQAQEFIVHQLLGRSGKVEGELVRRRPVGHLKTDTGVNREALVIACNELIEEMQDEANNMRQPRRFVVHAYNKQKGGNFAQKTIEREPKVGLHRIGHRGGGGGMEEDDPLDPLGGDILRKRAEVVLADGRFYAEHVTTSLGGVIQLLSEQLKVSTEQVNALFKSNMDYARLLNDAENNKLDRDLIRAERELVLTAKRKGIGMLAGLLPDFLKKVTGGAAEIPGGRSTESMVIEQIMDEKAGGLSAEEKHKIFGDWTDNGERLVPGILTENQVRIIIDVLNERAKPEVLDRLISDGSDEQFTTAQYAEIMNVLDGDMDKLMPFLKVLQDRKNVLDKKAEA